MLKTLAFLHELFRPWYVKVGGGLVTTLAIYDACCNQFGWPKIPKLWGMTGSLLPWWGWLLILQAVLVVALFDYVRRSFPEHDVEAADRLTVSSDEIQEMAENYKRLLDLERVFSEQIAELQRTTEIPISIARQITNGVAARERYDTAHEGIVNVERYIDGAKRAGELFSGSGAHDIAQWREFMRSHAMNLNIANAARKTLGIEGDFNQPRAFLENPERPVDGETAFANCPREMLMDYRRMQAQFVEVNQVLGGARRRAREELNSSIGAISRALDIKEIISAALG